MEHRQITLGILAHVDAGKTTLAESILYKTGSIRTAGRVDHGDAFLDTYPLEKQRGITIFSKQARFGLGDLEVTLLDTPGHVDFSAEMERTLQVLDYAVIVISGSDGVQGHVQTLWQLLSRYQIPTFLFINKMDQPGTDAERILALLREQLHGSCVRMPDFPWRMETEARILPDELAEEVAVCDEEYMEAYLDGKPLHLSDAAKLVRERKLFPCLFGSALKMEGIESFLDWLEALMIPPVWPEEFSARVYKIAREERTRLTFLKVTGGTLRVRQAFPEWDEKVDQIRIYSGAGYRTAAEAPAGTVCAVTGLSRTRAGSTLGAEKGAAAPVLEPILTYSVELPEGEDVHQTMIKLRQLEEEIPELHLFWNAGNGQILAQVMGEVQIEILQELILDRYGLKVHFGEGRIVYKETIDCVSEGVGHFEPLRHYAEVHLILEPGERGSGITLDTVCSTDDLDLNWQRLILTHLQERVHPGVLTGSELTDVRITLTAGKAHLKHTEGGDFRQATYRAVRQGLRRANSVLLEPVYRFRLEVPSAGIGRAMTDLQAMHASFEGPFDEGTFSVLKGTCPVACMRGYQTQVRIYTGGTGRLSCMAGGYEVCHNPEEVIAAIGYSPDADTDNPCGSVFCSHGAGMVVPWDQVEDYMHLEATLPAWTGQKVPAQIEPAQETATGGRRASRGVIPADVQDDDELMEIFQRTYGSIRQQRTGWKKTRSFSASGAGSSQSGKARENRKPPKEQVLLVDGYNIIYAWEELRELADGNMDGARGRLMDILSNYQGYRKMTLVLVFDAYRVSDGQEQVFRWHNIHVVYTKEAETADAYIERTVHRLAGQCDVTVATSDATEQIIIWGQGARRCPAGELREEIAAACREIQTDYLEKHPEGKRYLFDDLPADMEALMEQIRLGE